MSEHRFSAWTKGIGPLDPTLAALLKQRSTAMLGVPHAALPVVGPAARTAGDTDSWGAGPSAAAAPKAKLHLTRAVLRTISDAGDSAYLGSDAPDSLSTGSGPAAQAGSGAPSESGQSSVCPPEAAAFRAEADSPRSCTSHPLPDLLRSSEVRAGGVGRSGPAAAALNKMKCSDRQRRWVQEPDTAPVGVAAEASDAALADEPAPPQDRRRGGAADACWLVREAGLLVLAVAELLLVLAAAALATAGGGAAQTRLLGALMLVPIDAGRGAVRLAAVLLAALFQVAGSLAGVALALQGAAAAAVPAIAYEPSAR